MWILNNTLSFHSTHCYFQCVHLQNQLLFDILSPFYYQVFCMIIVSMYRCTLYFPGGGKRKLAFDYSIHKSNLSRIEKHTPYARYIDNLRHVWLINKRALVKWKHSISLPSYYCLLLWLLHVIANCLMFLLPFMFFVLLNLFWIGLFTPYRNAT